ncbi:hypothetical protein CEPID_09535 [Corynebacterium epidermidicanis]|uniref:ABC transporter substrate-binding protein n=1 Tax=Corynebacterium epidermidicanis TaxID=1050174 RepID=A0A0G3GY50_9CORY|nr:hypothetical protein CEPID_09535 [Corynebacterium epidermidicanis]
MNRKRCSFLALALSASLLVVGCSKTDVEQDNSQEQRYAALGLGDADTMLALGVTPAVVAPFSAQGDVPANGLEPWAQQLAEGKDI